MSKDQNVVGATPLATPRSSRRRRRRNDELRVARLCYGHLAGSLGVRMADALIIRGLALKGDGFCEVTREGESFLAEMGIDLRAMVRQGRALCRSCLDGTENRPHIGGALGAALAKRFLELGWLTKIDGSRALAITAAGRRCLSDVFGPDFFPDEEKSTNI